MLDHPPAQPHANRPTTATLLRIFAPARLAVGLIAATLATGLLAMGWRTALGGLYARVLLIALLVIVVFGVCEAWPRRLPRWLPRWRFQLACVIAVIPLSTFAIYAGSTPSGAPPFWQDEHRLSGFGMITMLGIIMVPWVCFSAIIRQRDAEMLSQSLRFDLEKNRLERQALDARMRLLQAQVAPHFLFNTLANVSELVEAGSPHAPAVLNSLVAYLRAAVPRLDEAESSVAQEMELVRAYLELMHMRMPDRLTYTVTASREAEDLHCPPLTVLTLVENAVRHGIDPSVGGGLITVSVAVRDAECIATVSDTGVGLRAALGAGGLGTGLASLRERLSLVFGGRARLTITENPPIGVRAEAAFPARRAEVNAPQHG